MKVVRYFHIRPEDEMKGGACVKVVGDTQFPGQVDVQYSLCSHKDAYIKKTGRSLADKAPLKVVSLRYLPNELWNIAENKAKIDDVAPIDFCFAIRYFLPKD